MKEIFVQKAKKIHNNLYDYALIEYVNNSTKVKILCIKCNTIFEQTPMNHIRSNNPCGCPECSIVKQAANKINNFKNKFVKRSKEIHGNLYDYSLVEYVHSNIPVKILCIKCNTIFEQKPVYHIRTKNPCGCPICGKIKVLETIEKLKITNVDFLERAKKIHGDKYTYLEPYVSSGSLMSIKCNRCNEIFKQTPHNHIDSQQGCKKCNNIEAGLNLRNTDFQFLERAKKIHGDKYTYLEPYVTTETKIKILCNKCNGIFDQRPHDHVNGKHGCPTCCKAGTGLEELIFKILIKCNIPFQQNVRRLLPNIRLELDFYVPSVNLAIECHGNYWHSELILPHSKAMAHMQNKFDQCNTKDITLFQFYEDEIRNKYELIESMIKYKLNIGKKIFARNTDKFFFKRSELSQIDKDLIENFFIKNHIQGISNYISGTMLIEKGTDEVVSIMLFNNITSNRGIKASNDEVELVRFCSEGIVIGGASRLFKLFLENNPLVTKIVSYSDNRISNGKLYDTLGFNKLLEVNPSYFYIKENTDSLIRHHKTKFKKSNQAKMFPAKYNGELTEYENAANNGYYRLWDAGKIKWVYTITTK